MSHGTLSRFAATMGIVALVALPAGPLVAADAQDEVSVTSRPDEVAIFLNGIAYARDSLALPGGVPVRVSLPLSVFADTLILREDGQRISPYRLDRGDGQLALEWQGQSEAGVREVTLEYLFGGVSWSPRYDLWLGEDTDTTIELDAFAQVTDDALAMDDVAVKLVAGRVDPSQVVDAVSQITANQFIAGYEEPLVVSAPTGSVDIQHVYDMGRLSVEPGEIAYLSLFGGSLPARRLHLWNAQADDQVSIITKVQNDSDIPFAEGIVRAYQDALFIGSDFMELTPVGGEGSVTVGFLPDVRVSRAQSSSALGESEFSYHDRVELTISNFSAEAVSLEVVDQLVPQAQDLSASIEPERTAGNLLRWQVTVEPSSTLVISYDYKTE